MQRAEDEADGAGGRERAVARDEELGDEEAEGGEHAAGRPPS